MVIRVQQKEEKETNLPSSKESGADHGDLKPNYIGLYELFILFPIHQSLRFSQFLLQKFHTLFQLFASGECILNAEILHQLGAEFHCHFGYKTYTIASYTKDCA